MLGGLLAAAMKGAGEGYSTYAKGEMENQQKLDYQSQLLKMQEEKDLRVDEITRTRNIDDIGRRTTAEANASLATAPTRAKAKVAEEQGTLQGALDSNLPELRATSAERNYDASRPLVQRQATDKATDEAAGQVTKTSTPGYLKSVAEETSAKESSGSKAQAAVANFELTQKKAIADLRGQLSREKDPTRREELTQQLQDLQLGTSTKSYSDVVTAAEGYRKMADNLRRDADKITDNEEERKAMLMRANEYEQQADYILRGAVGKRLPGAQQKPGAAQSVVRTQPAAKPWERDWSASTPATKP